MSWIGALKQSWIVGSARVDEWLTRSSPGGSVTNQTAPDRSRFILKDVSTHQSVQSGEGPRSGRARADQDTATTLESDSGCGGPVRAAGRYPRNRSPSSVLPPIWGSRQGLVGYLPGNQRTSNLPGKSRDDRKIVSRITVSGRTL